MAEAGPLPLIRTAPAACATRSGKTVRSGAAYEARASQAGVEEAEARGGAEEQQKFAREPAGVSFPQSVYRLGYLKDRDNQLMRLMDRLQSYGIPMGADDWADRALKYLDKLEYIKDSVCRILRDAEEDRYVDIHTLKDRYEHAIKMYQKGYPPMRFICDWCGWPGARNIGGGYQACTDCLPDEPPEAKTQPGPTSPAPPSP